MDRPVVRTITFFLEGVETDTVEEYLDNVESGINNVVEKYSELVEEKLGGRGYRVWTKRITLPRISKNLYKEMNRLIDGLKDLFTDSGFLINIGGISLNHIDDADIIVDIASNGFYTGLYWTGDPPIETVHEFFKRLADEDPEYATRVAVSLNGRPLMTPYYPLSTNTVGRRAVGLALLYPSVLRRVYRVGGLKGIEEYIIRVHDDLSKTLRNEGLGDIVFFIDHSISPWMEDSVARLLEDVAGGEVFFPGIVYAVAELNAVLDRIADRNREVLGFNEVMLPYAEDSRLMELGALGRLRARDLLRLSMTCVAGPDMIVVPYDADRLRSFIMESFRLGLGVGRVKALRIIPVAGSPGDNIVLGKFGRVPVIDY